MRTPHSQRVFFTFIVLSLSYALVSRTQDLVSAGDQALEQKDYFMALNYFREAVALDPQDTEAWRLLGYTFRQLDSLDQSVAAYQQVLRLNSTDYDARVALGSLYAMQEQYASALRQFEVILTQDSTDVEAWLGRAQTLAWQGKLNFAESAYHRALDLLPDYPRTLIGLGQVCSWQDKMSSAAGFYRQVLAQDSTYTEAWTGLGSVAMWTEQPYSATGYFAGALRVEPRNRPAQEGLAEVKRQTAWRFQPEYRYSVEQDADLQTEHEEMIFSSSRRWSDRVGITGRLRAYSSFRAGVFEYRRTLGGEVQVYPAWGWSLTGGAQADLLTAGVDQTTLSAAWRGFDDWRWVEAKAYYEHALYEIWSQTRSDGGWLESTLSPLTFFSVTLGGGLWSLSDGNHRRQGILSAGWTIKQRPHLVLLGRTRYLDFKRHVFGYYSPQNQLQHEIGATIDWKIIRPLTLSGASFYSINTDEIRSVWLQGGLQWQPRPDLNVHLRIEYFDTDQNYRYLLWNASLIFFSLP